MLLAACFLAAFAGFALLALGQARHAAAVAGAAPRPRPRFAATLLAASLAFGVRSEGWGFGLLAWTTLLTLAGVALVATLTWRPRLLQPFLLPIRRTPMTRTALATVLLLGAAATAMPAAAHMVWLERDGTAGAVQLYFGYPDRPLRERTGGALDAIGGPRAVGAEAASVTRQPDHVAFAGLPAGDVRVVEETLAPREDRQRGGRTRTVFLAREGRAETRAATPLELVPVAPGGDAFTLLFRGQPLPRTAVELAGPPGWIRKLRTDAEGRVSLPLPWAGRYVAEVQHLAEERGGEGEQAHERVRYVATLSFVTEQGIPWLAASR